MLEVKDLKAYLDTPAGIVKAVDQVSFTVKAGETVGIVGESGSGKSVLARALMQLNPTPLTFYPKGEILFEGRNLLGLRERELRQIRGNDISMVFQDPMSSLNPIFKVGVQLIEAVRAHKKMSRRQAEAEAVQLLQDVGIPDAKRRMHEYPHEFSGGMRQRVMIAIALACRPKLLIADEPTTALDVTIQAQILEMLQKIQKKYGTAIILITHDLGVVARLADRILVMYSGRIVEEGSTAQVFYETSMPYTWSLLRSIPRLDDGSKKRLIPIQGQPPNLIAPPKGCNFSPRCPFARAECKEIDPRLVHRGEEHRAACLLSEEEFEEQKSELNAVREEVVL